MTPGAAPDGSFGLVSFRGISGLLNGNTVDGGDNTQAFFAEERGRTRLAYSLSADAVREFQVTTSNYSAEYGRAAGGVVNAVTKSGTNNFDGTGFYFLRDNKLGETNPFQTQTVIQNGVNTTVQLKPKDRRQQFGGVIGGPIKRDKLFFFFSYDEQNRNFPGVAAPSNPGAFFAPFSAAEQAVFASRNISAAQQADGLTFLQGLTGVVDANRQPAPLPAEARLDDQQQPLLRRHLQPPALGFPGRRPDRGRRVPRRRELGQRRRARATGPPPGSPRFSARASSTKSASSGGATSSSSSASRRLPGQPVSATGPGAGSRHLRALAAFSFGKPNFLDRRAYPDERRTQVVDTLTLSRGAHSIKFGGEINHVSDTLDNLFQEGGVYAYTSRVDFISDYINNTRTTNPATPQLHRSSTRVWVRPRSSSRPMITPRSFRTRGASIRA